MSVNDDEGVEIPEGYQKYTRLGMNIIAPAGIPDFFIDSIIEGLVKSGQAVLNHETNEIEMVPGNEGEIGAMDLTFGKNGEVADAKALRGEELKNDNSEALRRLKKRMRKS